MRTAKKLTKHGREKSKKNGKKGGGPFAIAKIVKDGDNNTMNMNIHDIHDSNLKYFDSIGPCWLSTKQRRSFSFKQDKYCAEAICFSAKEPIEPYLSNSCLYAVFLNDKKMYSFDIKSPSPVCGEESRMIVPLKDGLFIHGSTCEVKIQNSQSKPYAWMKFPVNHKDETLYLAPTSAHVKQVVLEKFCFQDHSRKELDIVYTDDNNFELQAGQKKKWRYKNCKESESTPGWKECVAECIDGNKPCENAPTSYIHNVKDTLKKTKIKQLNRFQTAQIIWQCDCDEPTKYKSHFLAKTKKRKKCKCSKTKAKKHDESRDIAPQRNEIV